MSKHESKGTLAYSKGFQMSDAYLIQAVFPSLLSGSINGQGAAWKENGFIIKDWGAGDSAKQHPLYDLVLW